MPSTKRTVHLVDFDTRGHHLMYAHSIQTWLLEMGEQVQLCFIDDVQIQSIRSVGRLRSKAAFWLFLRERLALDPSDLVFFLYWETVKPFWLPMSARGFLLPNPILAIWMNTWGFRTLDRVLIRHRVVRQYPFLKERDLPVLILDEGVLPRLQPRAKAQLYFLGEFCSEWHTTRTQLLQELIAFREGKRLCLMLGAIIGSKSPDFFLEVVQRCPTNKWVFAVVGEVMVDGFLVKAFPYASLRVWNTRIGDEDEFNSIMCEADLVWGVYKHWEGSSNIVVKAGLFGVPVVVMRGFLSAERVRRYSLGYVIEDENPEEVLQVMDNLDRAPRSRTPDTKFSRMFSREHAKSVIQSVVVKPYQPARGTFHGLLILWSLGIRQQVLNLAKSLQAFFR